MGSMSDQLKLRKEEHIRICLEKPVEFEKSNGLDEYEFEHNALPDMNMDDVDTTTEFLGKKFTAPLYIEGMTGGTEEAKKININLAKAAQVIGLGMGVGSQRTAIRHPETEDTYRVRGVAPDILLIGNLGGAQLAEYGIEKVKKAVDMINADGLAIHLNVGQEAVQPEGNLKWKNVIGEIKKICSRVDFPIIAKETGNGISGTTAKKLQDAGVAAIDVAGAGGTNWIKVEYYRGAKNAEPFFEWGIKTAECLKQARENVSIPLIASGGMRTGLDVAKSIALGADVVGFALPLLRPATISADAVREKLEDIITELKKTMLLIGVKNIEELKKTTIRHFSFI